MNKIKAYNLVLKPYEQCTVYAADNGHLYSISNIDHPMLCQPEYIWNSSAQNKRDTRLMYRLGTWQCNKEELNELFESSTKDIIPTLTGGIILACQKDMGNDLVEACLCGLSSRNGDPELFTDDRNFHLEKISNRYLKMKAFW